jgi:cytochrome c-type biogenesis protein CcmH
MIAEGLTKDQIKDELVAEYGPDVLAEPETDGFDLLAWLVPGVVVLIGAVAIFVGLRRWRSAGIAAETDASAGGADALSTDEQDRLDADMARYE